MLALSNNLNIVEVIRKLSGKTISRKCKIKEVALKKMQHYHLVLAGDVSPDIDSGPGNSGQADMLRSSVPSPAPDPYLSIRICCINLVIRNLKCNHHAGLGPQLPALCKLRQLPHPHKVALRPGVDQAVRHRDREDLAVFFEDGRDAPVLGAGWVVTVELGGGGDGEGVVGRRRERGVLKARWDVGKVREGGFFGGDASEEDVGGLIISKCKGRALRW